MIILLEADFEPCQKFVKEIALQVLANGLPVGTVLKCEFPGRDKIKGIKICRQANAKWAEEFDMRFDPYKRPYYWLTGCFPK
jgi:5'-nucleotidase